MVYDVRTRSLDAIPTLRARLPWPGQDHQTGIHALRINPSRTLLATGARNSCELAVYSLPTLDPVCVGEAHKDWVSAIFLLNIILREALGSRQSVGVAAKRLITKKIHDRAIQN